MWTMRDYEMQQICLLHKCVIEISIKLTSLSEIR